MKITMLSEIDYAASGLKLCDALNMHTDHNVRLFTGRYYNKFKHPQRSHHTKRDIQRHVDQSGIVHLKGDWPPADGYLGIKISHKPVIVSVSGSHFRKKEHGGYEKYSLKEYDSARLRTAFTPDLLYEGFTEWTPHPIDSAKKPLAWKRAAHPVLMHTPSRRDIKDTQFIIEVFRKLAKRVKIESIIIDDMPFEKIVELRKEATIFFDQFRVGFYGNSAIEAMQYGVPVAAWMRSNGLLKDCPVISLTNKNVDLWAKMIEQVIDSDMKALSLETKRWCDFTHSYQVVARQWNKIYNAI